VHDALRHLPIAVLAAMTVQLIAVKDGEPFLTLDNLPLLVALPTIAIGLWTRNLFVTIAFGVGGLAVVRALTG
jgi:branched-subunit amino acid transport protein